MERLFNEMIINTNEIQMVFDNGMSLHYSDDRFWVSSNGEVLVASPDTLHLCNMIDDGGVDVVYMIYMAIGMYVSDFYYLYKDSPETVDKFFRLCFRNRVLRNRVTLSTLQYVDDPEYFVSIGDAIIIRKQNDLFVSHSGLDWKFVYISEEGRDYGRAVMGLERFQALEIVTLAGFLGVHLGETGIKARTVTKDRTSVQDVLVNDLSDLTRLMLG